MTRLLDCATSQKLVTTILLTFNEEAHIARAIESVQRFSEKVVVIDSFSTDGTVTIAKKVGADVLQNPFINQSKQFNWALANVEVNTPWILRLDADEIIGEDLGDAIVVELPRMPEEVAGITFDRRHIFMGRWVRHGGRFPLKLLRLWRTGQGKVEDRWMDEHVVIHGGRTVHINGRFEDASLRDLSFFTTKHNHYATREAVQVLVQRHGLLDAQTSDGQHSMGRQAEIKRVFKESLFNNLPFGIGPLCYFLFRYIFQLGFLDGQSGLIYHFLQGFWYRFLVNAKTVEMELLIARCETREQKLDALRTATGLKL